MLHFPAVATEIDPFVPSLYKYIKTFLEERGKSFICVELLSRLMLFSPGAHAKRHAHTRILAIW